MKTVLFRPFNLEKWLTLGFCAFLATLGQGGGGGGGGGSNFNGRINRGSFDDAKQWIIDNLDWLLPLAGGLVALGIGLWVLLTWLSSRGQFMFLSGVVTNHAEVKRPWSQYGGLANSLFLFRLVLGLSGLLLILPLMGFLGFLVFRMINAAQADQGTIITSVLLGIAAGVLSMIVLIVKSLTLSFVVPVMYLRNTPCLEAWREFWGLFSQYIGSFALYLLFVLVLRIALGIATFILVIITCCIAGCLLAIPYVGAVLLLPVTVFFRSYSLLFLSQFGDHYHAWRASAAAPQTQSGS